MFLNNYNKKITYNNTSLKRLGLTLLLFAFSAVFSQSGPPYMAPDTKYYTNTCTNYIGGTPLKPNLEYWDVWFNDDDEDCKSADWYVRYYFFDGSFEDRNDEYWRSIGMTSTNLDFNKFNCCDWITGRACGCEWEYQAITQTLTIDCSNCNGGGGMD